MRTWKKALALGGVVGMLALGATGTAVANEKIYTGGKTGSYFTTFGPLLKEVLTKQFFKYELATSAGSGENIKQVMTTPSAVALVQSDVLAQEVAANPDVGNKITVIRSDVAKECLFAVTSHANADRLKTWGDVLGFARRLKVVTGAADSGSATTLRFLQTIDEALKDATVINAVDIDKAIETVVAGQADIGFFVAFADTKNPRFKMINDKKLSFIPVVDRAMLRQQIKDTQVYVAQEVKVTSADIVHWRGVNKITTACVPIAYVTGNPDQLTGTAQADSKDLIQKVRSAELKQLQPKEPWFKQMIDDTVAASGAGLEGLLKTVDDAAKQIRK
ncbi:C4-dicarboxylate ABC transporter substrate-binding protein [Azospirillaceae bacterium]